MLESIQYILIFQELLCLWYCLHLSYVDPQVLLLISSVTDGQAQFVLLTGLVQLHLLWGSEVVGVRRRTVCSMTFTCK